MGLLVSSSVTGHQTNCPGWPVGRDDAVLLLSRNRFMFYFSAHLKDLSVTLIRAAVNARQCFLSIQRPLPPLTTIYWEEKWLYL